MVSIEKAVVSRFQKGRDNFEILVDSSLALEFKKGKEISLERILAIRDIFKDAKKGERASAKDLTKVFNTTDVFKVAAEIIKKGQIQLTTEQKRHLTEEKRAQVADIISKQGIDPKTKLPHPPVRILNAMDQAHVNIDTFKPAGEQVQPVLEKIQPILPISFETLEITIKVPIQFAGKVSSFIHSVVKIKKEEWKPDAWFAIIQIPAGMQSELYTKLNNLTSGTVEIKVSKKEG